jgi:hypothetical protein
MSDSDGESGDGRPRKGRVEGRCLEGRCLRLVAWRVQYGERLEAMLAVFST